MLEHLQRGEGFSRQDVGAHGLPLLGLVDWNDTVNLRPGAESLFTANLYGTVLHELIALLDHLGEMQAVDAHRAAYQAI